MATVEQTRVTFIKTTETNKWGNEEHFYKSSLGGNLGRLFQSQKDRKEGKGLWTHKDYRGSFRSFASIEAFEASLNKRFEGAAEKNAKRKSENGAAALAYDQWKASRPNDFSKHDERLVFDDKGHALRVIVKPQFGTLDKWVVLGENDPSYGGHKDYEVFKYLDLSEEEAFRKFNYEIGKDANWQCKHGDWSCYSPLEGEEAE